MRSQKALCSCIGWLGMMTLGVSCTGPTLESGDVEEVAEEACKTVLTSALVDDKGFNLQVPDTSPLRGMQLTIPKDALSRSTRVSLLVGRDVNGSGTPNSAPVCVKIEQGGALKRPALLVLPYKPEKLNGRGAEYLALAGLRMSGETTIESRMGGLLAVDEPNRLAGAEIDRDGIYQIISIGTGHPAITPDLSVLFVLDNSGSMVPKRKMLSDKFPDFFKQITHYNGDPRIRDCVQYNVGVLTTNMGSATTTGENGQLQNQFCNPNVGNQDAKDACNAAQCGLVTPLTAAQHYIHRGDIADPAMQERQFRCIANVGDQGSGVEQPLESLSQFLKAEQNPMTSTKFFREDAINAVVFVTDEGDCSFDAGKKAAFYADKTYPDENQRCLAMALECNAPGIDTPADAKLKCHNKTAGTLLKSPADYAKQLTSFMEGLSELHPVRQRELLYVRGLWPLQQTFNMFRPEIEFQMRVTNRPPSNTLGTDAFCWDTVDPTLLGHPQIRLDEFAQSITGGVGMPGTSPQVEVGSICNMVDRNNLLQDLAATFEKLETMTCHTKLLPSP